MIVVMGMKNGHIFHDALGRKKLAPRTLPSHE